MTGSNWTVIPGTEIGSAADELHARTLYLASDAAAISPPASELLKTAAELMEAAAEMMRADEPITRRPTDSDGQEVTR